MQPYCPAELPLPEFCSTSQESVKGVGLGSEEDGSTSDLIPLCAADSTRDKEKMKQTQGGDYVLGPGLMQLNPNFLKIEKCLGIHSKPFDPSGCCRHEFLHLNLHQPLVCPVNNQLWIREQRIHPKTFGPLIKIKMFALSVNIAYYWFILIDNERLGKNF